MPENSPSAQRGIKKSIIDFFKNPIAVFAYTIFLSFVVICTQDRFYQILGIILITIGFSSASFVYATWQEKVSAVRLSELNKELEEELGELKKRNESLVKSKEELEREIPKIIKYENITKKIKIMNANGDSKLHLVYEGKNVSNSSINKVRHIVSHSGEKLSKDTITNSRFNREIVSPEIKSAKVENWYRSEIILYPVNMVKPGEPVVCSFEMYFEGIYKDAFIKGDYTDHVIYLPTNKLSIEIEAPEKHIFHPSLEVNIFDFHNEIPAHDEIQRVLKENSPIFDTTKRRIFWTVETPVLSYVYRLHFRILKSA